MHLWCVLVPIVAAAWYSRGVVRGSPIRQARHGGEVGEGGPSKPASGEGTGGPSPATAVASALPIPARRRGRLVPTAASVAVSAASRAAAVPGVLDTIANSEAKPRRRRTTSQRNAAKRRFLERQAQQREANGEQAAAVAAGGDQDQTQAADEAPQGDTGTKE